MAAGKYKIKISPDRILGPIDVERIRALVMKGRIAGDEPTSTAPFTSWSSFSSYPELAELLLQKLELDSSKGKPRPQGTLTKMSSEPTKTLFESPSVVSSSNVEFEMPTLREIKIPEPQASAPDQEATKIQSLIPVNGDDVAEGGTRILSPIAVKNLMHRSAEPMAKAKIEAEVQGKPQKRGFFRRGKVDDAEYVMADGRRRILSRNTAAILAIGILFIAYFSPENKPEGEKPELSVRWHKFPYVEVNPPPTLGNKPDRATSESLLEEGKVLMEKESPSDYIRAVKKLYVAVGKNPENYRARGQLASAYIQLSEIIPRDEVLFNTLKKLLFPKPSGSANSPEYASGLAGYYLLLQRYDQAEESIDGYLKIRATPELYYEKALIEMERRNIDTATAFASKTLPPEGIPGNPRHLLLYARLLDKKGQTAAVKEVLGRLRKESPMYGPGLLMEAELRFRANNYTGAEKSLSVLVNNPATLNRMELADTFVLLAKNFEMLNNLPQALRFAEGALQARPDIESTEDLVYRIRSKIPATKQTYSLILEARQAEKSKQFDEAIRLYLRARESNRDDPTPNLLLGRLYVKNGQIFEAIDRYEKSMAQKKRPIEAPIEAANVFISRYDSEKAKVAIHLAEEMGLRKDAVVMLKAKMMAQQNQKELAKTIFKQALSAGSRMPELYLQMGDLEAAANQQELAEFYYAMALRYDPLNSDALRGVALARFSLETPTRAISFLKDKLNEQPNSAPIMTNLAVIYLSSGDQDSGKVYLQNAIQADPRYAKAFQLLGKLTQKEGDRQIDPSARLHSYRYALASYDMYSKLAPNDPEGFKAAGDLYFDVRDLGAAAKNYHQVLALAPNYPGINIRLAMISENGSDTQEAINFINKELSSNPRSDEAYTELGRVHLARQEYNEAIKALTKAIVYNESNTDALETLGKTYFIQGSLDNALSLFQRVIKIDPLYAEAYWEMGLIYQHQNNRQKAIQAFTNVLGIQKTDPRVQALARQKLRELN